MSALSRNVWDTVSNPGVVFSAGANTNNLTAVTFSNSNGVSFGLNAGVITATFSGGTGGGGAGTGFTSATTAGTAIVGTLNSNGLSVGIPAYLTTAALSQDTSKYAGTGFTTATTAGTNIVGTLATNGISLGVPAYLTTYVNDLTSGRAGTGFTSATTAGTAIVGTLNTNGLSVGVPAYLTTAALSGDTSKYAGTGFTTATTAGTAVVGTLNTNGISMGVPAYLTTSPAVTNSSWTVSDSATSVTVGRLMFSNANGVSFGLITSNNGSQSVTASIATTYAGTGFTSTSTAGANIVGTLNTSGLSLAVPAYLTTAMASGEGSNFVAATASFAGTNASGTIASNAISVSVAAPGGGATLSWWQNYVLGAGFNWLGNSSSNSAIRVLPFVMPQAISASYIRLPITCSMVSTTASNTTANTSYTFNKSYSQAVVIYSNGTGASSLSLQYVTSGLASWVFQISITHGATGSQYTVAHNITYPSQGVYSNFNTSYAVTSATLNISTDLLTGFTGNKFLDIPFANSLSADNYWAGFGISTATASNAGPNLSSAGLSITGTVAQIGSPLNWGQIGQATNSSNQLQLGLGIWTTNAAIMSTSSLALANISSEASGIMFHWQMIRQA